MYMEQVQAMDPLLGEAMVAARSVELALAKRWFAVIFETDSKLLWEVVMDGARTPRWKIVDLVDSLRLVFKAQSVWSLYWVPRKLKRQAHLLAKWAARSHRSGFCDVNCIPFHILYCDSDTPLF
ncbi:hypothetical protein CJ030_MR7G027599 [Morella rubra]|uniref:RNase H type-1 domain-containing protein n=1 Tax=Morella rubra TaxID=262757 RepID=A0A6A1V155_9ROSI|nr:hypothetical protein CJ030_MR7G027599 [Morella rubra]